MRGVAKDKEQNQHGGDGHTDIGPSDDALFAAVLADILGTERRKEDGGNHADDGQNGGQTHIADQNTVEQRVDDGLAGHLLCQLVRSVGGNVALQGSVVLENLDNVGHFQRFGLFGADKGFRLIVGRNAQTDQNGADTRGKQRHIAGSSQESLVVGAAAFGQQHNVENHRHCHRHQIVEGGCPYADGRALARIIRHDGGDGLRSHVGDGVADDVDNVQQGEYRQPQPLGREAGEHSVQGERLNQIARNQQNA